MKRISNIRDKELRTLRNFGLLHSTLECTWSATGFLVSFQSICNK